MTEGLPKKIQQGDAGLLTQEQIDEIQSAGAASVETASSISPEMQELREKALNLQERAKYAVDKSSMAGELEDLEKEIQAQERIESGEEKGGMHLSELESAVEPVEPLTPEVVKKSREQLKAAVTELSQYQQNHNIGYGETRYAHSILRNGLPIEMPKRVAAPPHDVPSRSIPVPVIERITAPELEASEAPIFGLNPVLMRLMQPRASRMWIGSSRERVEKKINAAPAQKKQVLEKIQNNPQNKSKLRSILVGFFSLIGASAVGFEGAAANTHQTVKSGQNEAGRQIDIREDIREVGVLKSLAARAHQAPVAPKAATQPAQPTKAAAPKVQPKAAEAKPPAREAKGAVKKEAVHRARRHISHARLEKGLHQAVSHSQISKDDAGLVMHWEARFGGLPLGSDHHIKDVVETIKAHPDDPNAFETRQFPTISARLHINPQERTQQVAASASAPTHAVNPATPGFSGLNEAEFGPGGRQEAPAAGTPIEAEPMDTWDQIQNGK